MLMTPKELGAYLKKIRETLGYSTYDVNRLCDISQSYLSLMENGKRKPSAVILKKIAPIYNLNYIDLYEKAGYIDLVEEERNNSIKNFVNAMEVIEKEYKEINCSKKVFPILGTVKAGYNYLAEDNFIGYISIDKEVSDPENYFALRITGDSMQPILYDNDIVIVHQQNDVENGQVGIVLIDGEEGTVKKIVKYDDHIDLIAFNSYYPPRRLDSNTNFKIIGKVMEARISKIFE